MQDLPIPAAAAAFERAAALTRERAPLIADAADIEHIQTLQQLGQVRRAAEMGDALYLFESQAPSPEVAHSTVTLFARFLGLSTSVPRATAV